MSVDAVQERDTVEVVFAVTVRFVGTVGGVVSTAFVMVRTSVADPVPPEFVALIAIFEVPAVVGLPEINPVAVFIERPAGRPVALKLAGLFSAVIW